MPSYTLCKAQTDVMSVYYVINKSKEVASSLLEQFFFKYHVNSIKFIAHQLMRQLMGDKFDAFFYELWNRPQILGKNFTKF